MSRVATHLALLVVGSGGRLPWRKSDQLGLHQGLPGQAARSPRTIPPDTLLMDLSILSLSGFLQRIGPRCPVRTRRAPTCGSQSQTTHPHWQRGALRANSSSPFSPGTCSSSAFATSRRFIMFSRIPNGERRRGEREVRKQWLA